MGTQSLACSLQAPLAPLVVQVTSSASSPLQVFHCLCVKVDLRARVGVRRHRQQAGEREIVEDGILNTQLRCADKSCAYVIAGGSTSTCSGQTPPPTGGSGRSWRTGF